MRNATYIAKDWLMMSLYHYEQCGKKSCDWCRNLISQAEAHDKTINEFIAWRKEHCRKARERMGIGEYSHA